MIDDLMDGIEDTFGKYKSGMRKAIIDKLSLIDNTSAKTLLRVLTEDYDMARPPSLKVIMGEIFKYGIPVITQGWGGMSVCEFCNYEFDESLITCPKCNKLRKYGEIRLYKMGDGCMHPFAIQEREKEIEAMEPTAEEARKFRELMEETGGLRGMLRDKIKNVRDRR